MVENITGSTLKNVVVLNTWVLHLEHGVMLMFNVFCACYLVANCDRDGRPADRHGLCTEEPD